MTLVENYHYLYALSLYSLLVFMILLSLRTNVMCIILIVKAAGGSGGGSGGGGKGDEKKAGDDSSEAKKGEIY